MRYRDIERLLVPCGLIARGGFVPADEDGVPYMPDGRRAGAVILVGNAGSAMWQSFSASPECHDGRSNPLDRWTARVVTAAAAASGARAVFPYTGPPYLPFLSWAMKAEGLRSSPIGMLIHPTFGLWHAYRAALLFGYGVEDMPRPRRAPHPCDTCADKPCLHSCPVGAFEKSGDPVARYAVRRCRTHVASDRGADCRGGGCLARSACPVGPEWRYDRAQAAFHMNAFLKAGGESGE